ncbi:MAG: hypothetical protein ACFFCS_08100 [Candidatus Hodarchaeota archaeon]
MYKQTINKEIIGSTFKIVPDDSIDGIYINNIKLDPMKVNHFDKRVDIKENQEMAFIIEHPISVLTIFGIHQARIVGTRETWDFYRACDREAYAMDLPPSSVVGPADGTISRDLIEQMKEVKIVETRNELKLLSVKEPVEYEVTKINKIRYQPVEDGQHELHVTLKFLNLGPIHAIIHPTWGLLNEERDGAIRYDVMNATTPALLATENETLFHALGDLVADIAGTGGIKVGKIDAVLGPRYHEATIGFVKYVINNKLIDE